jgi:dUTP pyrophosphatase
VKVALANIGNSPVELVKGHRIAQIRFGVVLPFEMDNVVYLEELGETDRGNGGFGSTGNE